jgi:magnesium-transporting ATPase (P-type)
MTPRESYKITENMIFSYNSERFKDRRYKLTIEKRFEFSSKFQANSVIIKNHLDGSYRYFIKGAPEKIIQICLPESLPSSLSEELLNHTSSGYRVLACASKPLPMNEEYEYEEKREGFEKDLIFLGLIIFRNKLKRDTKHIISKLKSSSLNLVMATGDNPFTSISVARESGLIGKYKEIFFCNVIKDHPDQCLELYNIKLGEHLNIGGLEINGITEELVNKFKNFLTKRGIIYINKISHSIQKERV